MQTVNSAACLLHRTTSSCPRQQYKQASRPLNLTRQKYRGASLPSWNHLLRLCRQDRQHESRRPTGLYDEMDDNIVNFTDVLHARRRGLTYLVKEFQLQKGFRQGRLVFLFLGQMRVEGGLWVWGLVIGKKKNSRSHELAF